MLQLLQPVRWDKRDVSGHAWLPHREAAPLATLPYRREDTEALGNHPELWGLCTDASRSEAWIPS